VALARLQEPQGYDLWWMAQPGAIQTHGWYVLFPVLTAAAVLALALVPFSIAPLIGVLIINLVVRTVTNKHIGQVTGSFRKLAPVVATAQSLSFLVGDDLEPITRPIGQDVAGLRRLKTLSRWSNENPLMLSLAARPLALMVNDFISVVYEYANTLFLLDASGVYFGAKDLRAQWPALLRVIEAIGDIDCAAAVSDYRERQPIWSRPEFVASGEVSAIDLCHPLIDEPVPNSISFQLGQGVLVTGSNMSGKSTFLRTLGVNAVLAQTINTCIAREYRAPRFDVRSCIGRADDLSAGKSYYVVEVEALIALIHSSERHQPHLILLDELFHGTNAVERIAAADAVLHAFVVDGGNAPKPHLVIAATHDQELIPLLAGRYAAYHFGDSIGPDGPVFDHRLTAGPSTTRTALALLRQKGAPEDLLARAESTARRLDERAR